MGHLDAEIRRAAKVLRAMMRRANELLAAGCTLDEAQCEALRRSLAQFDQLVILRGGAPGAPKLTAAAVALLTRCDPLACLRGVKLDYIDHLAMTCDALMRAGRTPAPQYLAALGSAVADFEAEHSCGDDAYLLAFAWDILAQAEAGIGEPTEDLDYERAEQHYRQPRRGAAPVLVRAGAIS